MRYASRTIRRGEPGMEGMHKLAVWIPAGIGSWGFKEGPEQICTTPVYPSDSPLRHLVAFAARPCISKKVVLKHTPSSLSGQRQHQGAPWGAMSCKYRLCRIDDAVGIAYLAIYKPCHHPLPEGRQFWQGCPQFRDTSNRCLSCVHTPQPSRVNVLFYPFFTGVIFRPMVSFIVYGIPVYNLRSALSYTHHPLICQAAPAVLQRTSSTPDTSRSCTRDT